MSMKLRRVNAADGSLYGYRFDCPGCGEPHIIPTVGPHAWGFNGDLDAPTFTPSLLVHERERERPDGGEGVIVKGQCHSFIRDGRIEFLSDCGHALAGKTVELAEVAPSSTATSSPRT
jgi:hypothetical protein